jgi:hypothetical protein
VFAFLQAGDPVPGAPPRGLYRVLVDDLQVTTSAGACP